MVTIHIKKHKEHSHQNIDDIKRLQEKHKRDLIQPRHPDGNLNLEFLDLYGFKNIRVTEYDVHYLERFGRRFLKAIIYKLKKQEAEEYESKSLHI